ncbi:16318_t:CDS:1, partial [Cetraspora pellucida]
LHKQLQRQETGGWREKLKTISRIAFHINMNQIHHAGMVKINNRIILSDTVYYYQIWDVGLSIMESEAHSIKHING